MQEVYRTLARLVGAEQVIGHAALSGLIREKETNTAGRLNKRRTFFDKPDVELGRSVGVHADVAAAEARNLRVIQHHRDDSERS